MPVNTSLGKRWRTSRTIFESSERSGASQIREALPEVFCMGVSHMPAKLEAENHEQDQAENL
jgi:hypothetical protein